MLVVAGLVLRRAALCWTGIAMLWLASTPLVSNEVMRAAQSWLIRKPLSTIVGFHRWIGALAAEC